MKLAKVAVLLPACLLIAGCSKTTNTGNAGSNTSSTTTTTTTKNTTMPTPSPQATAEATKSPATNSDTVSSPEAAAKGLFDAFGKHDRAAAAKFASDAAITKLFKESTGNEGMQFQGCNDEGGGLNCAYSYEGGALFMHITGSASTGYKVDAIEFIAD